MPHSPAPSVRLLAQITGLSPSTVATALSGSPRAAPATILKVQAAAKEIGYQHNPMVSALMSAMRRSQTSTLQGVLAAAEISEPDRPAHGPFHRELIAGCKEAAEDLGFKLEFYEVGIAGLTPERLSGVLKARGIRGLILLPAWRLPDFLRFDWNWFAGVYTDYIYETPTLNSVCCDHYRSVLELLHRLHARGYRRPGLMVEAGRDERIHLRTSAALRVFQASHPTVHAIEPLMSANLEEKSVLDWLTREAPDVILTHHAEVLDWIKHTGRRVPSDVGFVSLNLAKTKRKCAGLDLRPRQIGRCAVEILIGQIQRRAWGVPRLPTNTTIIGEFVDGPTLRPAESSPPQSFSKTESKAAH